MERKSRKNRIIALAVAGALVLALCVGLIIGAVTDNGNLAYTYVGKSVSLAVGNNAYADYLKQHGYDGTVSADKTEVDLYTYTTDGGLSATVLSEGVATEGNGAITWSFSVPSSGFYQVKLKYKPMQGAKADIVRSVAVDGKIPYDGWEKLTFYRWFDNNCAAELPLVSGNEVRPVSQETYDWTESWLSDPLERESAPYLLWLSEGQHTVTFTVVQEPLLVFGGITFAAAETAKPYDEFLSSLTAQVKPYTGENLTYQAERTAGGTKAVYKNSKSIRNLVDYTSPNSVPFHPYNGLLNTFGGSSWQTVGQTVTWEIEVPQEGLYALSFRARQGTERGILAFRRLSVNGNVPFAEASSLGFAYSTDFQNYVVGSADKPYLFHFKQGINTVSMEIVAGECVQPLCEIEESIAVLNEMYRKVVHITGTVPDKYIDYEIRKKVEGFVETMEAESTRLYEVVRYLEELTGEKGEMTANVEKMAIQAERLAKDPESVITELDAMENNLSTLGTCVTNLSEFPLEVDSFTLFAPDGELPDAEAGFFRKFWNGTIRFFSTFFNDQSKMSTDTDGDKPANGEELRVWVLGGQDQAQLIKSLIDSSYTGDATINLQLVPLNAVLPSTLADNGPDVVINMGYATVVDYAMRGALVDLSQLEGYDEMAVNYYPSAIDNVSFHDGVYGLPETQSFLMMYCRDDILAEEGLSAPKTWDEFEDVLVQLNAAEYDVYLPGVSLFNTMLYQYGGNLYTGEGNDYGIQSGLYSEESMQAFLRLTKFYTGYDVPLSANFANRFRSGEMPIGIADYTLYNTLELFAPEIRGLWSFHTLPGQQQEDGRINYSTLSTSTNTVILQKCDNVDAAWEFLRWWDSTDTQLSYAQLLEEVLGSSGRYATANKNVLQQLSWSGDSLTALQDQFAHSLYTPAVPGQYMTTRMVTYSFNNVVTDTQSMSAREALYLNLRKIDAELDRKRKELGHSYYDSNGKYVAGK
ncbi:MAG: extracellular solute-binding protein [Clostridia bacterium]|nr:extracellular solute-binding protein [Clostridia bacterium]